MTMIANNPIASKPNAASLPPAVLDNLAVRFRTGGLFLAMVRPDGTLLYHDGGADRFFQQLVAPLLRDSGVPGVACREELAGLSASSGVVTWSLVPGVAIAAFPCVHQRQLQGMVLLAAKAPEFSLSEEIVRLCSRLELDAMWLSQQADALPGYSQEALQRQARLVVSVLRDQLRVSSLEQEVDSLSLQLANSYEELSLIYQISSGMKVNRSAEEFFEQTCLDVMQVIDVQGMGVVLKGEGAFGREPALYGSLRLTPPHLRRLCDQLIPVLVQRKAPLLVNQLARDKGFSWLGEQATSLIAVPLQRQDQVLGCLFGLDKRGGDFNSMDSKLLNSIANESAIYLENLKLFEDAHGLMMGLLHALTSAVDAKDTYTCGHTERVALISRMLAREIGMPEIEVERIYMAGLLHDVGKIGVPEAVLQKAGKLTPEEFDLMKKHSQVGARILQDIKQIADVIPGVLYHHERYDGKGYPAGLAGEAIPLVGRIICLADCFDAMTSSRTYRKALPLEVALTEIRRCAGTQFDPVLAEHFLKIDLEQVRLMLRDHQLRSGKALDLQDAFRTSHAQNAQRTATGTEVQKQAASS